MSKVRWGVISTANIGLAKVIPGMQKGRHTAVTAIASRDQSRADAAAAMLGLAKAYGSYEALLADPDVDVVYIPTPNHLHVPLALQSIDAGKHVLVEKPVALDATQARELAAAAAAHPTLKIMEAFMYRHHPQWVMAKELATNGSIGELRTVQTAFSYYNVDPANVRNMGSLGGGGGLMDIGCYPISLSRFLFDAEPSRVAAIVDVDPAFNVDRLASGIMDFGRGTATFTVGTQIVPYQRVTIFGTDGCVEIEIPFNAPPSGSHCLWHRRGDETTTHDVGGHDQYTIQGDLMSRAILDDAPVPTPIGDAVANMAVIDAMFESAKTRSWVLGPGSRVPGTR
ncbi:MAG: Gfo/Idh/MocA family oxidoreductase [Acidobacteria bacterium]|nr:Gfo/Idh/MocA family oxidoreductase [Acidobacteriota bacterium]